MATVTAEDIRMVSERVQAAAEIVAPYERREPYDFEVFEPLMKMVPKERVPYDPPPQRPDETDREYYLVWRNHFNLWLLQRIDDYFKVKGGRLPSPSSDIDDDDDVRAQEALRNQENVLRGMNIVDREFFDVPVTYEEEPFEIPLEFWERQLRETRDKELPNKSSEHQKMDGSTLRLSIEQSPERAEGGSEMEPSRTSPVQNFEPTQKRKRRSLPVEDNTLEGSSKRQRTDKHPQLLTSSNTAGHKRKRDGKEPSDGLSSTGEPGEPSEKKRRLDAQWKTQPSQKRKRGSQENNEELQASQLGDGVLGSKRRRVGAAEATKAEQSPQDASTAAGSRRILPTAPPFRITRARWRQLSGEDAQLLQLDQSGKPYVQESKHATQEPAREQPSTSRNGSRPKKPASIDIKNSRKTKTTNTVKSGMRASTMASTKNNAITKDTTKTITKTRSRSASGKSRGRGRLPST